MKKITNYAPGLRGIVMKDGSTIWLEPGQSESIDLAKVVEPLPDLGTKPAAQDAGDSDRVTALEVENADLRSQVEKLSADLDKATKPAK